MHRGQLASLPAAEGRRAERRIVNLAASLREPGAVVADVEVVNLSTDGFAATTELPLEMGQQLWLKLPSLEAQKCQVIWCQDGKAGFQFNVPLHRGAIEELTEAGRKPVPRNHFGPRRAGGR